MFRKVLLSAAGVATVAAILLASPSDAWARHRRCCRGGYTAGYYGGGWNTGYYNNRCGQTSFANNCCGNAGLVGTAQGGTYNYGTNYAPQGYYGTNGQWIDGRNVYGNGNLTAGSEIHPPKPSDPSPAIPDPPTPDR